MRNLLLLLCIVGLSALSSAQAGRGDSLPQSALTSRDGGGTSQAGTRWWWMGSAVDSANLQYRMRQYAQCGIGTLEIVPVYGVQGHDGDNIDFLSPRWMEMLRLVMREARADSLQVDLSLGAGWPMGGPWVPASESACKAAFTDTVVSTAQVSSVRLMPPDGVAPDAHLAAKQVVHLGKGRSRVIALFASRARQRVKWPTPGGEGWVVDPFDRDAVAHYLQHVSAAFDSTATPYPHTFSLNGYEASDADWTPSLLTEFEQRRGYRLQDHLDQLVDRDSTTIAHYRQTLSELLLEHFAEQCTAWAHAHGAQTRAQAPGVPVNTIDYYAAVDIPEVKTVGLTPFGIKGLRVDDNHTRNALTDFPMLKLASSAAHITGKRLTGSDAFAWATEHFRTSLSQLKPDLDQLFCAGVNRVFLHGTPYSPANAPWPGWQYYASVDLSPTNSIWRDAPEFMHYIERCQQWLQQGQPDNDFLVYLPLNESWRHTVSRLDSMGYDCDCVSDRYLLATTVHHGQLRTVGGQRYRALVIPSGVTLTADMVAHLDTLRAQGATVITGIDTAALARAARHEEMKSVLRLKAIRRMDERGHYYFMANLTPNDVDGEVRLSVDEHAGWWYNPLNGERYAVESSGDKIRITLRSGESMFLRLLKDGSLCPDSLPARARVKGKPMVLDRKPWVLTFTGEMPRVAGRHKLDNVQTWETLGGTASATMGTGVYESSFKVTESQLAAAPRGFLIDLGDVRESARVYVNDSYIGCAWSVPFLLTTQLIHAGTNTIRIEVTNLPANRIADLDRRGKPWRVFNGPNMVDIHLQPSSYVNWAPMKSGLNSDVRLWGME